MNLETNVGVSAIVVRIAKEDILRLAILFLAAAPALAAPVDVELVLGVDTSRSMDFDELSLQREPRHFGALSGRGLVYFNLNDFGRALVAFEAALAVHPHMAGPLINAKAIRKILGEEI